MSRAATQGYNTLLAEAWFRSGDPILNALRSSPTLALLFGKPKITVKGGMRNVDFAGLHSFNLDYKTINVVTQYGAQFGGAIARGTAMTAPADLSIPNLVETNQFVTSFFLQEAGLTYDQVKEGMGKSWLGDKTYEQINADAFGIDYVNTISEQLWATGANKFAADGQLGSIRAYVSDGLTTATRSGGSGTNESDYANYAGNDRVTDARYRALYEEANSAALTPQIIRRAARRAQKNGATNLVLPLSTTRYGALEELVASSFPQQQTKDTKPGLEYALGGIDSMNIGQVTVYHDPWCPESTTWATLLDAPSLAAASNYNRAEMEMDKMPDRKAMWKLSSMMKHQFFVTAPNRCVLIEELTSL